MMRFSRFFALVLFVNTVLLSFAEIGIVAHRGFWKTDGSAQNSIRSIVKADSIKAFASEFDVWISTDDSLVVNHDAVFKDIDIENSDYNTIRNIKLDNGETLPSLEEYLLTAKTLSIPLILELKEHKNKERETVALPKIVEKLKDHNLVDRTTFISFSLDACKLFHELLPENEIYYLNGDLAPQQIKELGFAGIDYSRRALENHPEWVKESHDLGLKVNAWTINEDNHIRYFKDLGVDYITTNEPLRAMEIVNE